MSHNHSDHCLGLSQSDSDSTMSPGGLSDHDISNSLFDATPLSVCESPDCLSFLPSLDVNSFEEINLDILASTSSSPSSQSAPTDDPVATDRDLHLPQKETASPPCHKNATVGSKRHSSVMGDWDSQSDDQADGKTCDYSESFSTDSPLASSYPTITIAANNAVEAPVPLPRSLSSGTDSQTIDTVQINDGMQVKPCGRLTDKDIASLGEPLILLSKQQWQEDFKEDPRVQDRKRSKARMALSICVYGFEYPLAICWNNGSGAPGRNRKCEAARIFLPMPFGHTISIVFQSLGCARSIWAADRELSDMYELPAALSLVQKTGAQYGVWVCGAPREACQVGTGVVAMSRSYGKKHKSLH